MPELLTRVTVRRVNRGKTAQGALILTATAADGTVWTTTVRDLGLSAEALEEIEIGFLVLMGAAVDRDPAAVAVIREMETWPPVEG